MHESEDVEVIDRIKGFGSVKEKNKVLVLLFDSKVVLFIERADVVSTLPASDKAFLAG